jgi:hypothetical protein
MSTSKRFKKKIKNFRQGMTAWRVQGYPVEKRNYQSWGTDQSYLDETYGKGNAKFFSNGSELFFIYCETICKVPKKSSWGRVDWSGGKRKTHIFKSLNSMYGSMGNRFFRTQEQAQLFMNEIEQGKHPHLVHIEQEFMDMLDDILDDIRNSEFDESEY